MSSTILIAYATKHDSTHQAAEAVGSVLRGEGLEVDVRPAAEVDDVGPYASVVIGGALYMGRWHRDARRFLHRHRAALAQRPVYAFAMGPTDLEERSVTSAREQLDQALAKVPEVEPAATAVFGGVVDPADLPFPFNHVPAADARDPDAVRAWAGDIAAALTASRT